MADIGEGPPLSPLSQSLDPRWGITIDLRIFRKVTLNPVAETQGLQYLLFSILDIL